MIVAFFASLSLVPAFKSAVLTINSVKDPSIQKVCTSLTDSYNEKIFGKTSFINANGVVHKLLGQNLMNGVVKVSDGQLIIPVERFNVSKHAENLITFNKTLAKMNIPLLYVQFPSKTMSNDKRIPAGVEVYANENADDLLALIKAGGLQTFDLRENIAEQGISHPSLFFKTDHHWKPEGAFWAFGEIVDVLNERYDYGIDDFYTDPANYQKQVYKDWFLGARGKRVGQYFAGVDDISLISPKFPTEMSLSIPKHKITRTGSFSDAIFCMDRIKKKDYFSLNPYAAYIGGDYPLVVHKNPQAPCDKKLMIFEDSFTLPVQSFLSTCFTEIDVIDLRHYEKEALLEYIKVNEPDLVMIMYNNRSMSNRLMFEFS